MEDNETLTMEGLLNSFGLGGEAASTTEPEPEPANEEQAPSAPPEKASSESESNSDKQPAPEAEKKQEAPVLEPQQTDKSAAAFAAMRTQLKEQEQLIKQLGQAFGFQGEAKDIVAKLQGIRTEQQAKQSGIPAELLQRLQVLEQEKAERAEQDRKVAVYNQIGHFQKSMHLSQADTMTFLRQLAAAGKNPFEREIDLRSEYIVLNFERLQKEAIQKALEDQAKRDQHADAHSSTPSSTTGTGAAPQTEIKTVEALDAFLKANVKK